VAVAVVVVGRVWRPRTVPPCPTTRPFVVCQGKRRCRNRGTCRPARDPPGTRRCRQARLPVAVRGTRGAPCTSTTPPTILWATCPRRVTKRAILPTVMGQDTPATACKPLEGLGRCKMAARRTIAIRRSRVRMRPLSPMLVTTMGAEPPAQRSMHHSRTHGSTMTCRRK